MLHNHGGVLGETYIADGPGMSVSSKEDIQGSAVLIGLRIHALISLFILGRAAEFWFVAVYCENHTEHTNNT
jgi:hypothetical protein